MDGKRRTIVIGFGDQKKYGVDRDDETKVYIDRSGEKLKDVPITELVRIAQRMGAERIVCEDVNLGA